MAATEDKFGIEKTEGVISSHWGKGKAVQTWTRRPFEPLNRVSVIQTEIERTNPKEIELHWFIANHAWSCIYHIDMVYSKHSCVEEWVRGLGCSCFHSFFRVGK